MAPVGEIRRSATILDVGFTDDFPGGAIVMGIMIPHQKTPRTASALVALNPLWFISQLGIIFSFLVSPHPLYVFSHDLYIEKLVDQL